MPDVTLVQGLILRFTDNAGNALAGGTLFSYQAGTNTPYPTYTDSTGDFQNTNPIVLNSRGEVATNTGQSSGLWIPPDTAYKFVLFDALNNQIWSLDNVTQAGLTQNIIGLALYPRTDTETSVGVIPSNYGYPPGDVRRYGAMGDSVTDCAPAFVSAVSCNSVVTVPAASGTYNVNSTVTVTAGVTLQGNGGVINQTFGIFTFANNSAFSASETMPCFTPTSVVSFGYQSVANVYAAWFGFGGNFADTQNKTALLAAMNSLTTSTTLRGGTIVLPNTAANIAGDIVVPQPNLKILGQGWADSYSDSTQAGTLLQFTSGTTGFDLTAIFSAGLPNEYCLLEGLRINGLGILSYGITIQGTKFVKGCEVTGCQIAGIYLQDFINSCRIEETSCVSNNPVGGGVGLLVAGTSTTKFTISNCNFRLNFRGAEVTAGQNYVFESCVFESNTERGLYEHNADGSNLNCGLHQELWFENNNSITATRFQYTLSTVSTNPVFYPLGHRWVGGNVNGGTIAGQRAMDINSNCLSTVFSGTRFNGIVGDTGSIFVAAGTGTLFDDCFYVDTFASASAGNYRQRNNAQAFVNQLVTVPYTSGTSMVISATAGNEFDLTLTDNVAWGFSAPILPSIGQRITITVRNASGGALGAASWVATFKMSAWTNPANGNSRSIDFKFNGTNWIQVGQTGVDVPN